MTPGADGGRRLFLIEMEGGADALLRVLGPFAVQGATVTGLDLRTSPGGVELRIEAGGLGEQPALQLGAKLRGLPVVRTVGLGWLAGPII